ncbi:MAG: hypothetical protein ACFFEF_04335 [Candidatus Thorarchaeota archaeon]
MFSRRKNSILFTAILAWLVISPLALVLSGDISNQAIARDFAIAEISIDSPADLSFENGSRGEQIAWNATTENPKNFTITEVNSGETYDSGSWDGSLITVDLDYLYEENLTHTLPVTFIYECLVFNSNNESISDSVQVHVIADILAPIIITPANMTYEAGSFGHTITWNITETNPHIYNITRWSNETTSNFTVLEGGDWDGRNISINVDGLNATHWYIFALFVNDTLGFNATSIVNVTVFEDITAPVISSPEDIFYEFGDLGNEITWFTYDSNPANYSLQVIVLYNDTTYGNLSAIVGPPANLTKVQWTFSNPDGLNITFGIDRMYLGNYTFTLTLFDDFGRNSTDSVNVTVYKDIRAPVVNATLDFSYEEGYTGYKLNWTAVESNPLMYNLTRNGEVVMNGTWRGEDLEVSADGLAVGIYTFNMTLTDYFNQSSITLTVVTVTPDAHLPTIADVTVIESYTTISTNNITVQAYLWDLNNLSSTVIEWHTGDESASQEMNLTLEVNDLYVAKLGEYSHGQTVYYRITATDNSSVMNVQTTEWFEYKVEPMRSEGIPLLLWGTMLALGVLSSLAILWLYFRTKTRGR